MKLMLDTSDCKSSFALSTQYPLLNKPLDLLMPPLCMNHFLSLNLWQYNTEGQKKDTITYTWDFCRMPVPPYHNRELIMVRASPPTAVKSSTSTLFFYEV